MLIVLPGSGLSRNALRRLNDDFIIIEHLQPVAGVADLLLDVMRWFPSLLAEAEYPLLYLDRPVDADFLAEQANLGRRHAHEVLSELTGGRLTMLRLGEMVATSPLLPEFFAFLQGRSLDDATFVDLLDNAFSWTRV